MEREVDQPGRDAETPQSDELARQIDGLLDDMERACDDAREELGDAPEPERASLEPQTLDAELADLTSELLDVDMKVATADDLGVNIDLNAPEAPAAEGAATEPDPTPVEEASAESVMTESASLDEDLDALGDALLEETDSAVEAVAAQSETASESAGHDVLGDDLLEASFEPTDADAPSESSSTEMLAQLDDSADDAPTPEAAEIVDDQPEAADEQPAHISPESESLDDQVEQLATEEAEAPAPPPGNIGSLDEELAKLADDLMGGVGEEDSPDTEAVEPDPEPAPELEPVETAPTPEPDSVETKPEPAQKNPEPEPVAQDPAPEPVAEPKPARRVRWPKWKPLTTSGWKKVPAGAWQGVRLYSPPIAVLALIGLGKATAVLAPVADSALALMGKPLATKTPEFRQTVGWCGVVTLFTAAIAWVFVLTREPAPANAEDAPHQLEEKAADN